MDKANTVHRAASIRAIAPAYVMILAVAFGISAAFGPHPLADSLVDGPPVASQVAWGMVAGLTVSIPLVALILRLPLFRELREHSIVRSRMLDLRGLNPLWISLFAGIGEELLFRGALQPLLGVWLTCLIFALAHIQPSQYRSLTQGTIWYAAFVFLVSFLLAAIYTHRGLVAAMAFHVTGDLVGLLALRHIAREAESFAARD